MLQKSWKTYPMGYIQTLSFTMSVGRGHSFTKFSVACLHVPLPRALPQLGAAVGASGIARPPGIQLEAVGSSSILNVIAQLYTHHIFS